MYMPLPIHNFYAYKHYVKIQALGWVGEVLSSAHELHTRSTHQTLPLPAWSKEIQGYDRVWLPFPGEEFPPKLYAMIIIPGGPKSTYSIL